MDIHIKTKTVKYGITHDKIIHSMKYCVLDNLHAKHLEITLISKFYNTEFYTYEQKNDLYIGLRVFIPDRIYNILPFDIFLYFRTDTLNNIKYMINRIDRTYIFSHGKNYDIFERKANEREEPLNYSYSKDIIYDPSTVN